MRPMSKASRPSWSGLAAFSGRGSPSSSSWNFSGSLPAAWASSSMNDWWAKAMELEPGARIGPVERPSGITVCSRVMFGTRRAGISYSLKSAANCGMPLSP